MAGGGVRRENESSRAPPLAPTASPICSPNRRARLGERLKAFDRPPISTVTWGRGRLLSLSRKGLNSTSSRSGVTRCGVPVMGNTLWPARLSWVGGATRSKRCDPRNGSCSWTTKHAPCDHRRTPMDSGIEARPFPIQMSGHGGESLSRPSAIRTMSAGTSRVGARRIHVGQPIRFTSISAGLSRLIASARPKAWASIPTRPSETAQTRSGVVTECRRQTHSTMRIS